MKNLFKFLMSVAVLFTASCAQEAISSSIAGGEVEVSFTANLADLGTRAYGKAEEINNLRYYVFDQNNEPIDGLNANNTIQAETPGQKYYTVHLTLIKGMTYKVLFWADSGNGFYNINPEAGTVTVNYKNAEANDESRDAFYFVTPAFDPATADNRITTVNLTRPFAQLNVITKDYAQLAKSGVELTESKVVGYVPTTLNVFDGTLAKETAEVTFGFADIPTDEVANDDQTPLSMNYILAPADQKFLTNITVYYKGSTSVNFPAANYSNIPLKRNYKTNIIGDLLTKPTEFNVEIKTDFNKPAEEVTVVNNAAELQAALDNAAAGATIHLQPNVNYGTVYLRPVAGAANTVTDCDYLVYRNEMLRNVENLTIIGAAGAKVEAIKVVAGYVENSGSTGYVVDINNLVIDGVEFNDTFTNAPHSYAAPIFFDLTYTNVNGLTVKNCKLIGDNDKMNFVYLYGSGNPSNSTFETAAKNITISNNVVDGIARLCELRQTENVTITNNIIKNTYLHGMLLPVDGGTYSGNVTITGNTAEGIKDRFVRMAGTGDAVVVIKDNFIANYCGAESDYIKVTDGTNVTIENNTLGVKAENAAALQEALAQGKNVILANDLTISLAEMVTAPYGNKTVVSHKGGVFNGNGKTISCTAGGDHYVVMTNGGTIKNLDIDRGFRGIQLMYPNQDVYVDNVKIGVDDEVCYTINTAEGDGTHNLYVSNSTLNGWCSIGTAVKFVSFTNCTFGQGTYYTNVSGRLVKPYVDAVFDGCEFCSKAYIDLSAFVGTKVTVKNCTVNGVKITAENWTSLVAPEDTCGEGQISVELKNGTFLTAENVADYIVFE